MFKAKHWGVAAAMMLVAFGAMASNFRVADQVYIPIAGHIQGGSSLFVSDVFISNLTTDQVQVSLIYGPQNTAGIARAIAVGSQASFLLVYLLPCLPAEQCIHSLIRPWPGRSLCVLSYSDACYSA